MKISQPTICGIIGNPVQHSLSPAIHNAGYRKLGLDFEYKAWEVDDVKIAIEKMRRENIRGYSVTIPHKIEVMKYLDEVDEIAKKIGAVNTVVNENGLLKGFNTDWVGCVRAIEEEMKIEGKKVVVVGAGGAARGVVFGMRKRDCGDLVILNRTVEKAIELANEIGGAEAGSLDENDLYIGAEIIINTTSVGMEPNTEISPVPKELITADMLVQDIVYKPQMTQLIKDALQKGAKVVTGEKMLLYQGVAQFEMFTREKAPVALMEKILKEKLSA